MITPADIKLRFPEFSNVATARIQLFIDDATTVLNEAHWADKYNMGLSYYVAHLLALANRSEDGKTGSVGAATSRAVDGASVSYATPVPSSDQAAWLNSTVYGQRYSSLINTLGVTCFVI